MQRMSFFNINLGPLPEYLMLGEKEIKKGRENEIEEKETGKLGLLDIGLFPDKKQLGDLQISPTINNQYKIELQFAPLSPQLKHITRDKVVEITTHKVDPVKTETCCICYDEEVPSTDLLKCKHPVCKECTPLLQKAECPLCRTFLEGPLVTDEIVADLMNREEQARLNEITTNYLRGLYLEEHPEVNPEEVYEMFR